MLLCTVDGRRCSLVLLALIDAFFPHLEGRFVFKRANPSLSLGSCLRSQEISWAPWMDFPIPPSF